MEIRYKVNEKISVENFKKVLKNSTLANRRPIDDISCLTSMIENSNLIVTAWDNDKLVAIARSVTDYAYACYLSDLAVDISYQKLGIGKRLQQLTKEQLGNKCKLILISAPDANEYYPHIGFTKNDRCWVLNANEEII